MADLGIYDTMKAKHPALAQYDALSTQRVHLTGYYREKADKKMNETVMNLMADHRLIDRLKKISPQTAHQITNHLNCNLKQNWDHER